MTDQSQTAERTPLSEAWKEYARLFGYLPRGMEDALRQVFVAGWLARANAVISEIQEIRKISQ